MEFLLDYINRPLDFMFEYSFKATAKYRLQKAFCIFDTYLFTFNCNNSLEIIAELGTLITSFLC